MTSMEAQVLLALFWLQQALTMEPEDDAWKCVDRARSELAKAVRAA